MTGPLTGMVPGSRPRPDPMGASRYTAAHPLAPPPVADPAASRLGSPEDWVHDRRPGRPVAVPDGYAAIMVTNGHLGLQPGGVAVLRSAQAAEWVRQGLARPVLPV